MIRVNISPYKSPYCHYIIVGCHRLLSLGCVLVAIVPLVYFTMDAVFSSIVIFPFIFRISFYQCSSRSHVKFQTFVVCQYYTVCQSLRGESDDRTLGLTYRQKQRDAEMLSMASSDTFILLATRRGNRGLCFYAVLYYLFIYLFMYSFIHSFIYWFMP